MSMTTQAGLEMLNIICPHCAKTNRVPAARLAEQPQCGACKQALFEGQPAELSGAELERHIAADLPVVADFWAPWCGPCRVMGPIFAGAAREMEPLARFVKINTDVEQQIASQLDIRGIPTLIVFKNGQEVARSAGAMDAARFRAWLRANL